MIKIKSNSGKKIMIKKELRERLREKGGVLRCASKNMIGKINSPFGSDCSSRTRM